ncbi:MAG: GIY-YIG nuclease family protein [Pseudomonadales bacterium]|nr:GIY-YIG nuclease family protein [Pseudomonadales bacterium]
MSSAEQGFIDSIPGTYIVIFSCPRANEGKECQIGRLGKINLQQGYYSYVGSAFGPGGLKARLAHHLRLAKKPHWHLDYLKLHLQIEAIWFTRDPVRREHLWATAISREPGSAVPLSGFGSSDCDCTTHLFYSSINPEFGHFRQTLNKKTDQHQPIHIASGLDEKKGEPSDKNS